MLPKLRHVKIVALKDMHLGGFNLKTAFLQIIVTITPSNMMFGSDLMYDIQLASSNDPNPPMRNNTSSSVTIDGLMPGATYTVRAATVGINGTNSTFTEADDAITTGWCD